MEEVSGMMRYKKNIFFLFFGVLLFISIGCEDDPLLAPQTETTTDGGSYGMLQLNEDDDHSQEETNPEIY